MTLHDDRRRITEALALAEQAIGLSDPNPRVGCVIGREDGQLLGRGHTQHAGDAHAEIMALRDALARGHDVRGATAWVTLEPCAHHGRTPPCCDALIAAGITRVVVGARDPFPAVDGAGIARMRASGITVRMADTDLEQRSRELNIGFWSRVQRGRPWLRLKIAASLDGRTALHNGRSQWITGEAARTDGHAWRRRAGAVLTGIGTVLEDDPRLDVRLVPTVLQPMRVVVDSRLEMPESARIASPPGTVLLYAAQAEPARVDAWRARGVEVQQRPDPRGKVDLAAMLADLGARGVNELHVEAGHKLNGSLLRAGLVDELLVYLAPRLLGPGRDMAAFGPLESLADTLDWHYTDVLRIGDDLRVMARVCPRDAVTR